MTKGKVSQVNVGQIYEALKGDLQTCVRFHRRGKPEMVKEYFGTDNWDEIQKQLDVICKPFSFVQKVQIETVIADLHKFYI